MENISFKLILMECYFNGGWIFCDYIGGLFQRVMEDESRGMKRNIVLVKHIDYFDGGLFQLPVILEICIWNIINDFKSIAYSKA